MKRWIIPVMLFASVTALAGKEERDYMKKELQPAQQAAQAKWKSACGCALAVTIEDSVKTKQDMYLAQHMFEDITEHIGGYCTDKESRAAMCKLRAIDVRRGEEAAFTFKGGTGTATVDSSATPSFDMITREVDK